MAKEKIVQRVLKRKFHSWLESREEKDFSTLLRAFELPTICQEKEKQATIVIKMIFEKSSKLLHALKQHRADL